MKLLTRNSIAAVVSCAALALNAFAQAPAPIPAPASMVEVPSGEVKAAISEMLEAMNIRQMMNQMSTAMVQSMPLMLEQMMERSVSHLPSDQRAAAKQRSAATVGSFMEKGMAIYGDPEILKGMEEIMGRAYAKRFSLSEIKTITAFYKSEAGKKMMSVVPQLMQETMPEIVALTAPKVNALMEEVTKRAIEDAKAASANNKTPAVK